MQGIKSIVIIVFIAAVDAAIHLNVRLVIDMTTEPEDLRLPTIIRKF